MRTAIIFLLAVPCLAGCALFENTTPEEHLSRFRTIHQAVRTVAIKLHDLGYIDAEQWAKLEEIDKVAEAALDSAEEQIAAGASFDFGTLDEILASAQSIIAVARDAARAAGADVQPGPGE